MKRLGLEYQKVVGVWEGQFENSFLVWNTAYNFDDFERILLKLSKDYKQWGVCIGRKIEDKYIIDLWTTNSLDNIEYNKEEIFESGGILDSLEKAGTILTRHIYNNSGNVDINKTKQAIKFEEIERNRYVSASNSMAGYYTRQRLMEEMFKEEN